MKILDHLRSHATKAAKLAVAFFCARRAAAVALVNLEASLQRLIAEGAEVDVESHMTMVAYARRMSVMLTALASARNSVQLGADDVAAIDDRIGRGLDALARSETPPAEDPDAPPLPRAFNRLAEQYAILRSAAQRTFPGWGSRVSRDA